MVLPRACDARARCALIVAWLLLVQCAAAVAPTTTTGPLPPSPAPPQALNFNSSLALSASIVCLEGATCSVAAQLNIDMPPFGSSEQSLALQKVIQAVVAARGQAANSLGTAEAAGGGGVMVRVVVNITATTTTTTTTSSTTSSSTSSSTSSRTSTSTSSNANSGANTYTPNFLLLSQRSLHSSISIISGAQGGDIAYSFVGTYSDVQQTLAGVALRAGSDAWLGSFSSGGSHTTAFSVPGQVAITATTQVLDMGSWVSVSTAHNTATVAIARRNRPPTLTLLSDASIATPQGVSVKIAVSVGDVDYGLVSEAEAEEGFGERFGAGAVGPMRVQIGCMSGTLSLPASGAGVNVTCTSISRSSSSSGVGNACTLFGTPETLNPLLASITYTPLVGRTWVDGLEKVTLTLTDAGPWWTSGANPIPAATLNPTLNPTPTPPLAVSTVVTVRVDPLNLPPTLHVSRGGIPVLQVGSA